MASRKSNRGPLTRAEVIASALDLAEQVGIEKLSLKRIADEVGVQTMSLYNHIADKADLLDAMAATLLAGIVVPEPTDSWEVDLRALAHAFRAATMRYPRTAPLVLTRRLNAPPTLRVVDAGVTALRRAGVPRDQIVHALRTFIAYLLGSLIRESNISTLNTVINDVDQITHQGFKGIDYVADYLPTCDHTTEFDYGLDMLIRSIRQDQARPLLGKRPTGPPA